MASLDPVKDRKLINAIEKKEMFCQYVGGDDEFPSFCYSTTLTLLYDHPELLIVGLPSKNSLAVLRSAFDVVKEGTRLRVGMEPFGIISESYKCMLREVPDFFVKSDMRLAIRANQGKMVTALQILWPDSKGVFPGDSAHSFGDLQFKLW